MPTKRQSMLRAARTWMRVVLPPPWAIGVFVTGLLLWEFMAHVTFHGIRHWKDIGWHDATVAMHGPRDFWLAWGLAAYGLFRVVAKHPLYRPAYAEWLGRTPWRTGLPLPLGPVQLIPQDGIVLLLAWLITLDNSRWSLHSLATLLLFPYLVAILAPLQMARAKLHAYLIAYGLATAVWIGILSPSATLLLLALYLVAWHGLAPSHGGSEWNLSPLVLAFFRPNQFDRQTLPPAHQAPNPSVISYPFAQLGPRAPLPGLTMTDALLIAWLAAWWLHALSSNFTDPIDREGFCRFVSIAGIVACATLRGFVYFTEYRPPISFLGRLATRRLIIPGFDHAWLPMFFAMLVALAVFRSPFSDSSTFCSIALGLGLTFVFALPPRLEDWALTGNHHIVPSPNRKKEFIEL